MRKIIPLTDCNLINPVVKDIRYHNNDYRSHNSKKLQAFKVVQKEPNKREIIFAIN